MGKMEELPKHGQFAAGPGAAQAHYDQTKAESIELLRKQRGSYVMVLQGQGGSRVTGSFNGLVAKESDEQVEGTSLDVIAIKFLTYAIEALEDARRHYAGNLAQAIRDGGYEYTSDAD